MNKHTPGPWRANLYLGGAYAIDRVAPNGDRLGRVAVVDGLVETEANAILIAAAPDLADALKEAVGCYGKPGGPWNVPSDPGGWLKQARDALRKAGDIPGEVGG